MTTSFPSSKMGQKARDLGLQGDQVAMGQHGRLGQPGGPAGVGQGRQVCPGIDGDRRGAEGDISSAAPEKSRPPPF